MIKISENIKVTYKYALEMPTRTSSYSQLIRKWSENYLDHIYNGVYLLLISPFFRHEKMLFVQPTLDVDLNLTGGFNYLRKFFRRSKKRPKFWYAEYTGKKSFHIYAKFLVKIPDEFSDDVTKIRSLILSPFKNELKGIDTISSVRDVPIVRIGFRKETHRMAIPVLKDDLRWLVRVVRHKGFNGILDKVGLQTYIRNTLIPNNYIYLNQYHSYII